MMMINRGDDDDDDDDDDDGIEEGYNLQYRCCRKYFVLFRHSTIEDGL